MEFNTAAAAAAIAAAAAAAAAATTTGQSDKVDANMNYEVGTSRLGFGPQNKKLRRSA